MKDILEKDRGVILLGDFNDFDRSFAQKNIAVCKSDVLEKAKKDQLKNALAMVEDESKRYSNIYDDLIDHILYNNKLKAVSCKIYHTSDTPESESRTSDHFPVVAEFEM